MTDNPHPDPATAPPGEPHPPAVSHETSDADLRGIVGFAVALAGTIALLLVVLVWVFDGFKSREDREGESRFPLSAPERADLPQTTFGAPATGQLPNTPRLEGLDLASPTLLTGPERGEATARARYARDEEELNGYGKPGAVHIPIEQAMRLVAEESKPQGREPAPVRYDQGVEGTGGGSNSGRTLPEAKR